MRAGQKSNCVLRIQFSFIASAATPLVWQPREEKKRFLSKCKFLLHKLEIRSDVQEIEWRAKSTKFARKLWVLSLWYYNAYLPFVGRSTYIGLSGDPNGSPLNGGPISCNVRASVRAQIFAPPITATTK